MKEVLMFLRENAVWLHYVLIEYKLLYLDLWSIVHFGTGALLFAGLSVLHVKKRWKWLFIMVAGFEVLEATVFIGILKLFMPEKIPDVFIDIIVGMAGGYLVYYIFEKASFSNRAKQLIVTLISAGVIAFFWTGYYGYQLNIKLDNQLPFNIVAFLFWWFTGILIIVLCRYLSEFFANRFYATLSVLILFFVFYIPFYYLIADLLNIQELSHSKSFSIIGKLKMSQSSFKFAVVFPVLLVTIFGWFNHLSKKMHVYKQGV